ncbi:hypothetical protein HPO96_33725 [Kribbella sandramycini]|uniref:Uncharacterized protein n=1 Tax=Kribbella sandramycini TaxID=60450 RepID=A0A7Y4L6C9_9ACTN|nr:hypothetical protein [Kribbella sandramycini]MBB6570357.1 hypothetical protein [Kribbella sandramycini]NOL45219.1 hypothetical protein [Kribbella sandramycini]
MAVQQSVRNANEPWDSDEVARLRRFAAGNLPVCVIGLRLGRPEAAIKAKATAAGIKLLPRNRPPYGV